MHLAIKRAGICGWGEEILALCVSIRQENKRKLQIDDQKPVREQLFEYCLLFREQSCSAVHARYEMVIDRQNRLRFVIPISSHVINLLMKHLLISPTNFMPCKVVPYAKSSIIPKLPI